MSADNDGDISLHYEVKFGDCKYLMNEITRLNPRIRDRMAFAENKRKITPVNLACLNLLSSKTFGF